MNIDEGLFFARKQKKKPNVKKRDLLFVAFIVRASEMKSRRDGKKRIIDHV